MKKNLLAFTLVELIIVIGVLAITTSVAIAVINPAQKLELANDAVRANALATIKLAVDSYTTVNEGVPPSCEGLASCPTDFFEITGSDPLSAKILTLEHLKTIPLPPQSGGQICRFYAKLYPTAQKKYELRGCFTSWDEQKVQEVNRSGNYNCQWDRANRVALCYVGTEYDLPVP